MNINLITDAWNDYLPLKKKRQIERFKVYK